DVAGQNALAGDLDTNRGEQAAHAITVVGPFAPELIELPVQVPLILISRIWHLDYAPHVGLAFRKANEQSDQADSVQTVGLGTSGTTIDLDAGRINDHIVDAMVM